MNRHPIHYNRTCMFLCNSLTSMLLCMKRKEVELADNTLVNKAYFVPHHGTRNNGKMRVHVRPLFCFSSPARSIVLSPHTLPIIGIIGLMHMCRFFVHVACMECSEWSTPGPSMSTVWTANVLEGAYCIGMLDVFNRQMPHFMFFMG